MFKFRVNYYYKSHSVYTFVCVFDIKMCLSVCVSLTHGQGESGQVVTILKNYYHSRHLIVSVFNAIDHSVCLNRRV